MIKPWVYPLAIMVALVLTGMAYQNGYSAGEKSIEAKVKVFNNQTYVKYDKKFKKQIGAYKKTCDSEIRRCKGIISDQQKTINELGMKGS